jgi:hypothetical protein
MPHHEHGMFALWPFDQFKQIVMAALGREFIAQFVLAPQWQQGLLCTHSRTAEDTDPIWQLLVQPTCHALSLSLTSDRQWSLHIGFAFVEFVGFCMSPKYEIHEPNPPVSKRVLCESTMTNR